MLRVKEVDRIMRSCKGTQFKQTVGPWKNKIGPTPSMDKHCMSRVGEMLVDLCFQYDNVNNKIEIQDNNKIK